jgi:general secretion pathway protein G
MLFATLLKHNWLYRHFGQKMSTQNKTRRGFTLVELVIVILILGILAAVAAPKMFDTAGKARISATRHSLSVVRDAVQLFRAENGSLPGTGGEADLKSDLLPFLNGAFPIAEVGNSNDDVRVQSAGTPLSPSGAQGWAYDSLSGELIVNHADGAGF